MYDEILFRHLIIRLLEIIRNSLKIRDGIPSRHTYWIYNKLVLIIVLNLRKIEMILNKSSFSVQL